MSLSSRQRVGIDLAPIGFRSRAPGTAVHVENQVRALLAMEVEWDWVLVATPRVLSDSPFFAQFRPTVLSDASLSYHVAMRLGPSWRRSQCALGLATAFFTPLTGPPVVTNYFDANALHPVRDDQSVKAQVKTAFLRSLTRFSRRRSRALFILSEYGRARMIEAEPQTAGKWVVAPCGCPPVPRTKYPPGWAARLEGRPFILYAGAFSENKNQRRLIGAWDRLRRRHSALPALVLIGPAPPGYLSDVIEPARLRSIAPDEIIIPGFLPAEEVGWAFHEAFAYVHPSFAEGFGMPVIEAMSCGVPVACSDSTSLPEVAGSAALLFDPSDEESIAGAVERLVFDDAERARLISAGRARAHTFTWEAHAAIVAARIRQELSRVQSGRV